ncbi:threonine synthase [Mesorhizobium sp. BH1-1-5]|uniref:threonine synthase n=1 Tax=Mesorhizobium sp. BH1-1-5 TaxID=2876661 RepID=UPI001CCCDBD8|nr:threonine synthase [Mesorhizobium sp. BH1-1-5]MBZ9990954.1 threonine synthase [Mesorhizobium sp. BH1-1-5]
MASRPFRDLADNMTAHSTGEISRPGTVESRVLEFACIRCGAVYPADVTIDSKGCSRCRDSAPANLRPLYAVPQRDALNGTTNPRSLWRFEHMLPCTAADAVTLGEGLTPLLAAPRVGAFLGVPNLAIKDEGRNPTWSHKDRFSTVAVSVARARGAKIVATASSGNAGASLAAYAARAGLKCVVTTFAGSSGAMLAQIRKYGATVLPLVSKMDRWSLLEQAAARYDWFIASPYHGPVVGSHPLGIEGYKTIAYEIVEQSDGTAPDWCVLPVCYGDALSGVWAGFCELYAQGSISRLPRLVAAEVHGSLADALASGADALSEREMLFDSLAVSIGTPRSTFQALKALRDSGGHAVPVNNHALIAMQERLARDEGIFAELASVTPLIAISTLKDQGVIAATDRVVAVVTASGLKDLDRSAGSNEHGQIFQTTDDAWRWLDKNGPDLAS